MNLERNLYHDSELHRKIKNICWELRIPRRHWFRAITYVYENDEEIKKKIDEAVLNLRIEYQESKAKKRGQYNELTTQCVQTETKDR